MRDEFRTDLAEVSRTLVAMGSAVRVAMQRATSALLTADQADAAEVIARDAEIDALYRIVEDRVYSLLARQAPVASDLRLVLTALHIGADLERMGDLADHVAQTALRRHPAPAVPPSPPELTEVITRMGEVADRIAEKITTTLSTSDIVSATQLDRDDDEMDELYRRLFQIVLDKEWQHGVPEAIDCALLGRWYERYADHAVNVSHHVVFLVTGSMPE
jgi:phosphate transport system protein